MVFLKRVVVMLTAYIILLYATEKNIIADDLPFISMVDSFYETRENQILCVVPNHEFLLDQKSGCGDGASSDYRSFLENDSISSSTSVVVSIVRSTSYGDLSQYGSLEQEDSIMPDAFQKGYFKYTPGTIAIGSLQYLFSGTDTFDYVLSDGFITSATTTATINVIPSNNPPTSLRTDPYKINEDTPTTLTFYKYHFASTTPGGVMYDITFLSDDVDSLEKYELAFLKYKNNSEDFSDLDNLHNSFLVFDNDAGTINLNFIKLSDPAHGTITVATSSTSFFYTPQADYAGEDSFDFKFDDGTCEVNLTCQSDKLTLNIEVENINDGPTVSLVGSSSVGYLLGENIPSPLETDVNYFDVDSGDVLTVDIFTNGILGGTIDNSIASTSQIVYRISDSGIPKKFAYATKTIIVSTSPITIIAENTIQECTNDFDDDYDLLTDSLDFDCRAILFPVQSSDIDGDTITNQNDIDIDGDGILNIYERGDDDDLDNDGLKNRFDFDDDGDGVLDINDSLPRGIGSEENFDADIILNRFDTDLDGDGLHNENDSDIDGDGILNDIDSDIDGDGILNEVDKTSRGGSFGDIDGDGILNEVDPDVDGDGLNNIFDPDVDGDGLNNDIDNDKDEDGLQDAYDFYLFGLGSTLDIDGDGIINIFDVDVDGDGLVNTEDEDDDGDGNNDISDSSPTGKGKPNDFDEDGISNDTDDDIDCDNIHNHADKDTDGDGLRNEIDEDIDGDNIINNSDIDMLGYSQVKVTPIAIVSESTPRVLNLVSNGFVFTGQNFGQVDYSSGGQNIIFIGGGTGIVLGASTTRSDTDKNCSLYLNSDIVIRPGRKNKIEDVRKLQIFLNKELSLNIPTSGFYGRATQNAVRRFQIKYKSDILSPWGLHIPTSNVYYSTVHKINSIECKSANTIFDRFKLIPLI